VCLKRINSLSQIFRPFIPKISVSFKSYIVQIISICLAWILQPLQFSLFHFIEQFWAINILKLNSTGAECGPEVDSHNHSNGHEVPWQKKHFWTVEMRNANGKVLYYQITDKTHRDVSCTTIVANWRKRGLNSEEIYKTLFPFKSYETQATSMTTFYTLSLSLCLAFKKQYIWGKSFDQAMLSKLENKRKLAKNFVTNKCD
jgi:hypothetical protein